MTNSEKIQILKENIKNYIQSSKDVDENYLFNFAKQQAKEMRIEISKGEIKSIIYEIINLEKNKNEDYIMIDLYKNNLSYKKFIKELENEDPFIYF